MKSKRWSLKTFTVNYLVLRIFQFSDLAASFNLGTPMETKLAKFSRISDPSLSCTRANGHLLHLMVRAGFKTSATVAAVSALTAPVVGVLSSALLLGETLSWQKGIALAAILFSIALTTINPKRN